MGPLYAAVDMHRLAIGHGRPNPQARRARSTRVDVVRQLLDTQGRSERARSKAAILQRHHTAGDCVARRRRDAVHARRQVGRRRGDAAAAGRRRRSEADACRIRPNALMFAAGLGWRDGSPAAPSYDQGTPEDADRRRSRCCSSAASTSTPPTTPATRRCTWRSPAAASPEIVRVPVARGANLKAKNKRGQTPLAAAMASRKDLGHLVEILKAAEAP